MGVQKSAREYSAYKVLWEEKITNLITNLGSIEEDTSKIPLLKLQSTYKPFIQKIDITVFKNGEITVWKSQVLFMDNSPEVNLKAQLGEELLNEIKRLLDKEALQKQKSCFKAMKDGYSSTLTLYLNDKVKVIHNENCEKSEFTLAYQCLDFLLSLILGVLK